MMKILKSYEIFEFWFYIFFLIFKFSNFLKLLTPYRWYIDPPPPPPPPPPPFKDHSCHVCFKLAYWFQRKFFLNIFPIGSYVKTLSADGGHLGWRSGSQDIILKVDHLRTIHAMFALNWLTGFRGKDF
jgi:hypothetical protein